MYIGLPNLGLNGVGGGLKPSLNLNFTSTETPDSRLTISGGAGGTRFDSTGTLVSTSAPRYDYNPSTLAARGLLIEEQRTNSVRNNTMVGAISGSPGTMPTNWFINASGDGLSRQVVGTGVENGITYLDLRYSGTIAVGGVSFNNFFENSGSTIAAVSGQTWMNSVYFRLVNGSFANITNLQVSQRGLAADGTTVTENFFGTNIVASVNGSALSSQRYSNSSLLANASTAFIQPFFRFITGVATNNVDFTIRIGLPQLELGFFATSVIQTSTVTVTRTMDSVTMTGSNFSSWWTATGGTLVAKAMVGAPIGSGVAHHIFTLSDNTVNNEIKTYLRNVSATGVSVVTAGATQFDVSPTGGSYIVGDVKKIAFAVAPSDFAASINGNALSTGASGTVPTVNRLFLGCENGSNCLNGWVQSLQYYTSRIPNASLQVLST